MKIVLVNKFLYPKGGDAISTLRTGELLTSRGHQVFYWGMKHPLNNRYPNDDTFVSTVDFSGVGSIRSQIQAVCRILYSTEARTKFATLVDRVKPDLVHLNNFAHQISPSILPVLTRRGIPAVMTMHDYKLVCPIYLLYRQGRPCEQCRDRAFYHCLQHRCNKGSALKSLVNVVEMYLHEQILGLYDRIGLYLVVSPFMARMVAAMGFRRPVKVMPNILDCRQFQPVYGSPDRTVVYFGRLIHEKGILTLLDAAKGLKGRLKIVGDGPLGGVVRQRIADESLDNVVWVGFQAGQALRQHIADATATVVPSEWYEPFGYTIFEAHAMGKAVVGSRLGAISDIIREGQTGLTFEPGNPVDLREKLNQLLESPDLAATMGRNARHQIEREFDLETSYERLIGYYHQAAGR